MMDAYEKVLLARKKNRPTSKEYINNMFTNFIEFHGDRYFGDDKAIISGIGLLGDIPVTIIGMEKGKDTEERICRNFGCAHPEGYRKSLRHMKLAEKFGRPIICFVDTIGAYCGVAAEERGQARSIADNIMEMMGLRVPIFSIFIGEGGSGGALALAVADEIWMLENTFFSVISPEGCASILWKDTSKVAEASEALKFTAQDLYSFGIVERIIEEEQGDYSNVYKELKRCLIDSVQCKLKCNKEQLLLSRYYKYRNIGSTFLDSNNLDLEGITE